jgi:Tfp pilus assembly protein PilF
MPLLAGCLLVFCWSLAYGETPPERKSFTLEGKLTPVRYAMVSLHAVDGPHTADATVYWDGKFKFKNLAQGSYIVIAYVPRVGEFRRTYSVGPSTVDKKGRMQVTIYAHPSRATRVSTPKERFTVSATRLSISDKARKHYSDAIKKLKKNDTAEAVALLEKAVSISPQFAAAWNQLGTLAYQKRDYEMATKHFREAHEQDAEMFEPVVNLGGVLLQTEQLEEALKFNKDAVGRRPKDPLANAQLGLTFMLMKDYRSAVEHLNATKRMDPGHFTHPQLTLAEIYRRMGRAQAAATELESFLRYHPDSERADSVRTALAKLRQAAGAQ